MNNPCQVGLKRIGMKMKLLYACQQVHRTWWMTHNAAVSLWNLCSFVHDPFPAASTLLPKSSDFTNFGPCCISPCLTQWLVVVSAQRFCRMSERQCLLWVILHLPPSLDQPHLDMVWDGRLSHSPLLPSQLPLGALNLMDMHRVEKSGPELDSLLINQARHMGVRCPAELVPVILYDGLTSKESGRWPSLLSQNVGPEWAWGCCPPRRKAWVEHLHFRDDHVAGGGALVWQSSAHCLTLHPRSCGPPGPAAC